MKSASPFQRANWLSVCVLTLLMFFSHARLAPAAVINQQPHSTNVLAGSNATFTVVAGGTAPLRYRWSFNGTNLTNSGRISGATNATLTISNVVTGDAGGYRVVVSNSVSVVTSSVATLTVLLPPTITTQPTNQSVPVYSDVTFFAAASGTGPLFYQWQKDGLNLTGGGRVGGATNSVLTVSDVQAGDIGNYRLIVTNVYGAATSVVANLMVQPLVVWGVSNTVPQAFTNAVAIAAGSYHVQYVYLGLKSDKTIASWGVDVPAGLSNVVAVSAGYRHGLALASNGTVTGYGDDSFGETDTPSGLSNVVDVAAGGDYSIALKTDGTVVGWGYALPPDGLTNLLTVSAGTFHSLAIRDDGTITGWGYNEYGEATAPAGLSNVVAVSAGAFHSLALKSDGTVVAWGINYYGESMAAPDGLSNVVAVAGGWSHALALRSDGTVVAWGSNDNGQTNTPAGLTNAVAIAAGNLHSLALLPNPAAQLPPVIRWMGATNRTIPFGQTALILPALTGSLPMHFQWFSNNVALPGGTNRWLLLSSAKPEQSGSYSLVITNDAGSVTSSIVTLTITPPTPPTFPVQPTNQSVLYGNTAVIAASVAGTPPLVYQWQKNGANLFDGGRLAGATGATLTISNAQPGDQGSYQLVVTSPYGTNTSTPAVLSVVPVVAWGYNPQGQAVVPLDFTNVISVDAKNGRSIALRSDGTVAVWPQNPSTDPPAGLSNVVAVAQGYDPSAALKSDGTITAWGPNLASPGNPTNVVAIAVGNYNVIVLQGDTTASGLGVWPASNVLSISSGDNHTLMARDDGTIVGSGNNSSGQAAAPAGLSNVVAVSAGAYHSLALKSDGTVFAWGYNLFGQCNVPAGLSNVVDIAAGYMHNLALRTDGSVVAWGDNSYGESGIPSNLSNVVAIAGGNCYSVAIVKNPATPIPPSIWWPGSTNRILNPGGTAVFVPKVNGSRPMVFQWFFNGTPMAGQTNRWLVLPSTSTQQSGAYYFSVTNQYGSATSPIITISEAPTMLSQPLSQFILLGSNATFAAAAAGDATLGYQWYFNGAPLADGGRVNGSTTTNLTIASVQTNDAGSYQLVVTNNSGSVTSAVASLTVLVPAMIVIQPTNQTVVLSSNVTFSATAGGTAPFGYLWYSNGTALANGGRISGATSTNLTIANVQTNDSGTGYQLVVTNNYGSATSAVATLTVLAPIQITGQPASRAVLLGSNATFTITVTGSGPLAYQWLFNGALLSDGNRISGSATPVLTVSNVQSGDAGGYAAVVTNPLSSATSRTATLTPQTILAPSIRHVALTSANPSTPYLDWTTAATNIQDAIDASVAGDLVLVSNGIYSTGGRAIYGQATNRVNLDRAVTVQSVNGPASTLIKGDYTAPTHGGPNARCAYLTNGAVLSGFTLTNGGTLFTTNIVLESSGGGIWCEPSGGVVSNCVLAGNVAARFGGGAFQGTLFNCILTNNTASQGAGACSNVLFNCTVMKNTANYQSLNVGGGALSCVLSNCLLVANYCSGGGGGGAALSTLVGCVLSNNAANYGGGLASSVAYNCLISSNRAVSSGGGAYGGALLNCVLKTNLAGRTGGGVYSSALTNCTVVGNNAPSIGGVDGTEGGAVANSIIYNNAGGNLSSTKSVFFVCSSPYFGTGSITNAPLFVNEAGGDFHLQSNSPCINSGNNAYVSVTNDFDGNPRIVGGTVDIGAYEYQTPGSVISYAWLQQYSLPTDGSVDYLDLDGTGMNNWQKWVAGLNPTNPASVLVMLPLVATNNPTGVTVIWQSVNTRTYFLQRATNLAAQPAFSVLRSNIVGQAATTSYTDTTATNGGPYFYRIGVQR
jgi:alpha-tubulin suppressor-like RCC1 family protein